MSFFILIAPIAGYLFYLWIKDKKRKKLERLAREAEVITGHLLKIRSAVSTFFSAKNLSNYQDGYFTNYELISWKGSVTPLYEIIKDIVYDEIGLDTSDMEVIRKFHDYYQNGQAHRN